MPTRSLALFAALVLTSCTEPVAEGDIDGLFEHCAQDHCESLALKDGRFTESISSNRKLVHQQQGRFGTYGNPPFDRIEFDRICVTSSSRDQLDCMREYPAQIEKRRFFGCRIRIHIWDDADNIHTLSKICR